MAARMTHRERLLAAIRRQPLDKIPCSPRLGEALYIYYGIPRTTPWALQQPSNPDFHLALRAARDPAVDLDPHLQTSTGVPNPIFAWDDNSYGLREVKLDYSKQDDGDCEIITRLFHTPAGDLRERLRMPKPGTPLYGVDPNPSHLERLVKGPEDLDAVRYLVPRVEDYDVGATYRTVAKWAGEDGLVYAFVRSPMDSQAGWAYPMEDLMVDYFERREFFDVLLNIWHEKMMAELKAVLERGAKAVFVSWYFTSMSVGWSPAIFRDAFLPAIKASVALVDSYRAIYDYYDDGKCMGIIDMVKEAGVDVFQTLTPPPVGDADLAEIKRRIGDAVCLMGYTDLIYVLEKGTPRQVTKTVREAIEIAGPTGFILGTSDGIRESTPRENITAYFAAAKKYGKI